MKGCYVVCAVLLATSSFAETLLEMNDPSIPRDKCGVTIGSNDDETTSIFILGTDKSFHYKYEIRSDGENTQWSDWITLSGQFRGGPTVVRSSDGRLEVFGRGADNAIWHKYQPEPNSLSWTQWSSLGANKFVSDPVAILSSEGFIHIFAKGADNTLMHKTQFTNNTMFVWTEWASLGGSLTSQPAVVLDAEGLIHIFVRGPDRALWHKHQIGGQEPRFIKWSEWQSLGGVLASAPRVPISLNVVNLIEVFVRASDKAYWHRSQVASLPTMEREVDWSEWRSLGGVFSSGPSTVINGDGLLEAYGRGADKAIWRKVQYLSDGVPQWSTWSSIRGITSTGPTTRVRRQDGLVDVFVRGVDKQIWMKGQMILTNSTEFGMWRSLDGVLADAFGC